MSKGFNRNGLSPLRYSSFSFNLRVNEQGEGILIFYARPE